MSHCLAETLVGFTSGTLPIAALGDGSWAKVVSGHELPLGQIMTWVPQWLTPLWVIAVGLSLGALAAAAVYFLLGMLSLIPALGNLANDPRRAIISSLGIGTILSAALCFTFVPKAESYSESMYLPLICIGMLLGFGMIYGMWNRTRREWSSMMTEGVVPYLLSVILLFVFIGLAATPLVEEPLEFIRSIPEVNVIGDGTVIKRVTIAGLPDLDPEQVDQAPFVPAGISYDLRTASELDVESDKTILLGDAADPANFVRVPYRVNADELLTYRYADREMPPIPGDPTLLHIQNREIDDAHVVFRFKYRPTVPEASSSVVIGVTLFLAITAVMVFRQAAPRVWALALSTAKNEMAQPLYLLLLTIGMFGVLVFGIYPFNTLGDDIRILKDSGVTLIMVLGMLQAVWSAGTSVSEEIEGRTALTVLSKPVSRRSFILGKYAGIMLSVLVLFVIIGAVLLIVISYKPIYDARETTRDVTTWQMGHAEIMTTLPVLGLYFMETMAIGAVAVAMATRLPLLANFITCFVVYLIGNLTSPLVASTEGNNELVGFVGKLIAVIVPNLNVFNVQSAVDVGNPIPAIYLSAAFNYLVCFVIAVWMLAMLLFEDRDLA